MSISFLEQDGYISSIENEDLLKIDASITAGVPFLFPGISASVSGVFEMDKKTEVYLRLWLLSKSIIGLTRY